LPAIAHARRTAGLRAPPNKRTEHCFLAPDNQRTQSVECNEDGEVLTISYERLLELYFQNPEFGYYFLRLTSERLLQSVARLEAIIAQNPGSRRRATQSKTYKSELWRVGYRWNPSRRAS